MSGRLLLVGWEAADWNILHPLIDRGGLPALAKLLPEGVSGPLACPSPLVGAAQWTSLATGKRAWQHGIHLPFPVAGDAKEPLGARERKSRALWEILAERGHRSLVVGWPATHGGNFPGASVSDRFHLPTASPGHRWPPAAGGTYHPPGLAPRLDSLRVNPEEIDPATVALFVPGWKQIDQARDPVLSRLRLILAAEFSYQAAITELLASEPWGFAAVRFPATGEICRLFARDHASSEATPTGRNASLFHGVVRTAYQVLDAMLGRLVDLAGPGTAVVLVSPNGVFPTAAPNFSGTDGESWKRPHGIFVAKGAGFERDALVHGANVLDVVPTILNWFDLPAGDDMEGRSLGECFSTPRIIANCATWEPTSPVENPAAARGDDFRPEHRQAFDWNFARSCLDAGRFQQALPTLEELFREFPENVTFSRALFQTQLALSLLDDAGETLEVSLESLPPSEALLPQAELALARHETEPARRLLFQILEHRAHSPQAWRRIGLLLVALREWNRLDQVARQVIAHDEHDEIAWLGLAEASLRKNDSKAAAAAAKRAIGLRFFLPEAHFVLARALAAQGMPVAAIEATERLLRIHPANTTAAKYLRRLRHSIGQPA